MTVILRIAQVPFLGVRRRRVGISKLQTPCLVAAPPRQEATRAVAQHREKTGLRRPTAVRHMSASTTCTTASRTLTAGSRTLTAGFRTRSGTRAQTHARRHACADTRAQTGLRTLRAGFRTVRAEARSVMSPQASESIGDSSNSRGPLGAGPAVEDPERLPRPIARRRRVRRRSGTGAPRRRPRRRSRSNPNPQAARRGACPWP